MDYKWFNEALYSERKENSIVMEAANNTNLFNSPSGSFKCNNFPFYYLDVTGDFVFRCKVTVQFEALYDLGSIVVYDNEDKWIKFAYENSDAGHTAMVSVVTDKYSDDCNGEAVTGSVWMQLLRKDNTFALHFSKDHIHWSLVRLFHMDMDVQTKVGVSVQCPTGASCRAYFEDMELLENSYSNIRKPE